jgi:hypothetical protein
MVQQDNHGYTTPRKQIGYFCHLRLGEKHMGAVLVTNHIGVPVEFKYTEPVTATKLHKILYGAVLDRYLHETVIRDRLSREVRSDPDFFLAPYDEREFLGMLAGRDMIAIQRYQSPPGESPGAFNRIREREALVEVEEGSALRLAFFTTDEALQRILATKLQEIARYMDVIEPLERINSALRSICGEEKRASVSG